MRKLSENFILALKKGVLWPILNIARNDLTLCLEIRKDYINIYYRGGNILKIKREANCYSAFFDTKYLDKNTTKVPERRPRTLSESKDVSAWIDAVPFLKHEMDLWFGKNPKDEREFQQLVVRENNFGGSAKSTDYFICDIEYANTSGRFDLIAVRWPSSGHERKNNKNIGISFIEMKYLDHALKGKAGLRKHVQDMDKFLSVKTRLCALKEEMCTVFNQMLDLKLIRNQKPIANFNNEKPEFIIILANHDPDSSLLRKELLALEKSYKNMDLKFAISNFMGYGLYKENMYTLKDFLKRFDKQI